jgi:hypothetical protein
MPRVLNSLGIAIVWVLFWLSFNVIRIYWHASDRFIAVADKEKIKR